MASLSRTSSSAVASVNAAASKLSQRLGSSARRDLSTVATRSISQRSNAFRTPSILHHDSVFASPISFSRCTPSRQRRSDYSVASAIAPSLYRPSAVERRSAASSLDSRATAATTFLGLNQRRTLFRSPWGANSNTNHLANLEQVANNNPGSATAQNAFYQALLRQNMPHIIVERHSTGQYASNPAVEAAYARALEQSGGQELGRIGSTNFGPSSNGQGGQLSSEQLQAIGQAVAAKSRGSGVATARSGTGGKNEPLYVVVEESWRTTLFAIFRTALFYLFALYIFTVIITFGMEMFTPLRKLGGASGANEAKPELQKTRFSDVHGCDEAKEDLQELVDFLKNPDSFSTLGGKLPKGVLLVGPPGTGKTLLARAVAGEAGVPFFYMSGSEFDEMYVGVGAKRVRELFAAARAKSPSIIFIDELDAVGGKRNERDPGYAKQTLNQLLTELDGFDQTTGIVLIGATNLPQALDKALVRPGRFDRNVSVPLPDVRGRIAILKHHLEKVKTDASVDPAIIARGCPGFSGAELENVVNQAAVHASKNKSTKITEADLSWAKDKVLMGAERRSAVIQAKDKLMTAYHEGGHALVGMLTAGNDPLYKATIMPRGQALGVTHFLPELDRVSMSKKELEARIDMAMGGKMAEELIYGSDNVTTGASSDITNATNTAYHMVTQAGMSATLGNVDLASDYERLSSETKQKIEDEVRRLVEEGRARALKLLTDNRAALERLAIALVEYETLDREEMEKIVRGEQLVGKIKADPNAMIKLPDSAPPPPDISAPPGPISLPGITTGSSKNVES